MVENKETASDEVKEAGKTGQMLSEKQIDEDLRKIATGTYDIVEKRMEELRAADAISDIFALFKRLNKYIDETEPWVLAKDESKKDRLATVLYHLCEGIMIGASLLRPFMPDTAEKIAGQLNSSLYDFDTLSSFGQFVSGTKVTDQPEILFARLDKEEILKKAAEVEEAQRKEYVAHQKKATENLLAAGRISKEEAEAKLRQLSGGEAAAEEGVIDIEKKEEITFEDFGKMQFQVGHIIACEEVPKSKKLLCSQVKVGSKTLQIVSGIKAHYSPADMVGKKVMVLVNLKPAKLAGVLSEGMLLCAEDADGNLALMVPDKTMPAGAEIC